MNFPTLTIGQDQTLARRDTQTKRDIVLFCHGKGSSLSSHKTSGLAKPKPKEER
jgi:hypothetical protein